MSKREEVKVSQEDLNRQREIIIELLPLSLRSEVGDSYELRSTERIFSRRSPSSQRLIAKLPCEDLNLRSHLGRDEYSTQDNPIRAKQDVSRLCFDSHSTNKAD